jgi:hypothetical protein
MTEVVLELQHPSLYQIPLLGPFSNSAHCFVVWICLSIHSQQGHCKPLRANSSHPIFANGHQPQSYQVSPV